MSEGFAVFDENDRLAIYNERYPELFPELKDVIKTGVRFQTIIRTAIDRKVIDTEGIEPGEYLERRLTNHQNPSKRFIQRLRGERWVAIFEYKMENGGTVGVWNDITELKQREFQLLQAQKMEAVGQLTGGIAHDFNNLLAVILGNLDFIRTKLGKEEESTIQELVLRAQAGAQRGVHLVSRLLSFSKKQQLDSRAVNVKELITSMVEWLQRSLGASIRIETEFEDDLPLALIDENQLESALLNLAVNSRDAMPRGGKLRIRAKSVPVELVVADLPDNIKKSKNYLAISVSDDGIGIDDKIKNRIFEPFFSTKEVGRGTGLGLSMVYGFVNQSGGTIKVNSEPSSGTEVIIYLPTSASARKTIGNEPVDIPVPITPKRKTVLVVEDDADVRAVTTTMLRDNGFVVHETEDAIKARELLKTEEHVDLLLADVVLPNGMSGPELADKVKEERENIAVLLVSGYTREELPVDANYRLLNKPFSKERLFSTINEVLEELPQQDDEHDAQVANL